MQAVSKLTERLEEAIDNPLFHVAHSGSGLDDLLVDDHLFALVPLNLGLESQDGQLGVAGVHPAHVGA